MTAIPYPDRDAVSADGRYALEARSPHNGTIAHRDGRPVDEGDYRFRCRDHQGEFRYRLVDNVLEGVVWERWQDVREDSPSELVVSDDGWSVVRTHGFSPEVIVVSPGGEDVLRVEVVGQPDGQALGKDELEEAAAGRRPNAVAWQADHLSLTTAGTMWAGNSWRYFFRAGGSDYFAWRTSWGQRLVIDLGRAELVDEDEQADPEIAAACREEEIRWATAILAEVARRAGEIPALRNRRRRDPHADAVPPLIESLYRVPAAANLAGVHRVEACVPSLRRLEEIESEGSSMSSFAFDRGCNLQAQLLRPIVQHALRLIGLEPRGLPAYRFGRGDKATAAPDRTTLRERATGVNLGMGARRVLGILGSPDHVRTESQPADGGYYWVEEWEYDFRDDGRWVTLRVVWHQTDGRAKMARIEEAPSYWVDSARRSAEILWW